MHQRTSAMERPSFSLLEPSDFFLLSFFTFCSSIFAGFIFALLLAYFLSTTSTTATLIWSWRPQRIGRFNIDEFAPENAEHLQPLINDLLTVSRVTGNRIMWSEREETDDSQRRSDCQLRKALDLCELVSPASPFGDIRPIEIWSWCSLLADSYTQHKLVVSSRHQNKD